MQCVLKITRSRARLHWLLAGRRVGLSRAPAYVLNRHLTFGCFTCDSQRLIFTVQILKHTQEFVCVCFADTTLYRMSRSTRSR